MGFTTSRYDADVWYRLNEDGSGYDYVGTHTDDLLVVAKDAAVILDTCRLSIQLYVGEAVKKWRTS